MDCELYVFVSLCFIQVLYVFQVCENKMTFQNKPHWFTEVVSDFQLLLIFQSEKHYIPDLPALDWMLQVLWCF
jgi:hypothetical protein